MSSAIVRIDEAAVIAVHEFTSFKGFGSDYYVEAKSGNCTVYFQVVLYDNEARRNRGYFPEGTIVTVEGTLKMKTYSKNDGSAGYSLVIENPDIFRKKSIVSSDQQLPQQTTMIDSSIPRINAGTAAAITATSRKQEPLFDEDEPLY